jgi:hypothetical protein
MDTHPFWLLYRPDLYRGATARKLLALLVTAAIAALWEIYVVLTCKQCRSTSDSL